MASIPQETTTPRVSYTVANPGLKDATITDATNRTLYYIETPEDTSVEPPHLPPTSIFHTDVNGNKVLLNRFEWQSTGPTMIDYGKGFDKRALDTAFQAQSWPSKARMVPMPTGHWKWTVTKGGFELFDDNKHSVARYTHSADSSTATLEVEGRANDSLDKVVDGLVVMIHDAETRAHKKGILSYIGF